MNILVTGVSKGLGLETTRLILKKGWTVYGISRSTNEDLEKLLKEFPESFRHYKYDLRNSSDIRKNIFKDWIGMNVPVHGLVNNAAMAYDDIVTNIKLEKLEELFRVNVFSGLLLTKYAIRQMLLHKVNGSIVHVSSISTQTGYKGLAMYASTKGALEAFSKNAAREWGKLGIRSNCILPGFMETDMTAELDMEVKQKIFNQNAFKKPVDLKSVAETICFLLSENAAAITGQNIIVDNGTI